MMRARRVLVILLVAFTAASTIAALTTIRQMRTEMSSVSPPGIKIKI